MPEHDPKNNDTLDARGIKQWVFGYTYELPAEPEDGRNWFNATAVVDTALEVTTSSDVRGSAFERKIDGKYVLLFHMVAIGFYTEALELATNETNHALAAASLSLSKLVELIYLDPDEPLSTEPPF